MLALLCGGRLKGCPGFCCGDEREQVNWVIALVTGIFTLLGYQVGRLHGRVDAERAGMGKLKEVCDTIEKLADDIESKWDKP